MNPHRSGYQMETHQGDGRITMRRAIGRWAVLAVAVPLAAVGARRIGQAVEARRGSNRVSRLLHKGADTLQGMTGRKRRHRFGFR
jgi:hypothetical protein